jgi:hypothetical protein
MLLPCDLIKNKEIHSLLFQDSVVEKLKQVFGNNLTFYPDFQVQRNMFGYPGWHTDSNSESGKYLYDSNYLFAKCGLFLQENTARWGGGVNFMTGFHRSHSSPNKIVRLYFKILKNLLYKLINIFPALSNFFMVKIDSGDLVIFDSRLPHASTLPRAYDLTKLKNAYAEDFPDEHTKLVIYLNISNEAMVQDFYENSKKRSLSEEKGQEIYFTDYLQYHFPTDYNETLVNFFNVHDIGMASLSKVECQKFAEGFKDKKI